MSIYFLAFFQKEIFKTSQPLILDLIIFTVSLFENNAGEKTMKRKDVYEKFDRDFKREWMRRGKAGENMEVKDGKLISYTFGTPLRDRGEITFRLRCGLIYDLRFSKMGADNNFVTDKTGYYTIHDSLDLFELYSKDGKKAAASFAIERSEEEVIGDE